MSQDDLTLNVQLVVATKDGRHISITGDIPRSELDDWFSRAAKGVTTIFTSGDDSVTFRCTYCGSMKINAIKEVRNFCGIGLKEAKDFVEGTINVNVKQKDSNRFVHELKKLDCHVFIV